MVNYKSDTKGIKQALKKEIIRLGIQDNPSRTVYQKEYERGVAPSPNNAIKVTGMKWQELMENLGFEYDGKKNIETSLAKVIASGRKNTRGPAVNLENTAIRDEYIDKVVSIIKTKGYTTPNDLEKNLKNDIDISYQTLKKQGVNWNMLVKAYRDKYGEAIITRGENERINWNQFTNKELLDIITKLIIDYNINSMTDYKIKMTGKKNAPSIELLNKRFKANNSEIWRMIQINGDLPLK